MKSRLKTGSVSRIPEKIFCITILGLSQKWDYKSNIDYIFEIKKR